MPGPPQPPGSNLVQVYSEGSRRTLELSGRINLTKDRATGRDIVLAIGENMRQSLEPLVTKTIAPSLYQVYLHADDYDRLRTLFGELEAEAKALLDGELERLNRGAAPAFPRILRKKKDEPPARRSTSAPRGSGRCASRRTRTAR